MERFHKNNVFSTKVKRVLETEPAVVSGLALTPSQMYDLALQGQPIASNTLPDEYFNEGSKEEGFHVAKYKERGVDVADVWNEEKKQNRRISKAYGEYKKSVESQKTE